jgi:hypothetical protein
VPNVLETAMHGLLDVEFKEFPPRNMRGLLSDAKVTFCSTQVLPLPSINWQMPNERDDVNPVKAQLGLY